MFKNDGWRKLDKLLTTNKIKYVFNCDVEDLYILDGKKLVTCYMAYGSIVCPSIKDRYDVESWSGGRIHTDKRLKKVGMIFQPKWDKYELDWVERKSKMIAKEVERDRGLRCSEMN